MKLIINRIRTKGCSTDGTLSIDGVKICDTAEATATMLATGKYEIRIYKCSRSKRNIPIVQFDGDDRYQGCPIKPKCSHCADAAYRRKCMQMHQYDMLYESDFTEEQRDEIREFETEVAGESRVMIDEAEKSALRPYDPCCPRIIPGNGVFNRTDGAIIIGRYLAPGILSQSRPVFDRLYDRLEKAIVRGNSVQLIIRENLD